MTNVTDGTNGKKEEIPFIVYFFVCVLIFGCGLLVGILPTMFLETQYEKGYLRGQTDAYVRGWNNTYIDSSNVNVKEWKVRHKYR